MHYRLYLLNEEGRIMRGLDLDCADDCAATATARDHDSPHGIELWRGSERVFRRARPSIRMAIPPRDPAAGPVNFLARCHAGYANGIGDVDL